MYLCLLYLLLATCENVTEIYVVKNVQYYSVFFTGSLLHRCVTVLCVYAAGKFVHSNAAVESTQICAAVYTWQCIHHI